jgi:aryl-alcohol dehydrogenase-like predicted oxidoreductase
MLISGFATQVGTSHYKHRFEDRMPGHFREAQGLWLSSIGLGTYLGDADEETDRKYIEATKRALSSGINVIDSAINYRHQRSERAVGRALGALVADGTINREEVILATKGGFLNFDGDEPDNPEEYFTKTLIDPGFLRPQDVVASCHAMSPDFIAHEIATSRANLGVETIDIYYLHNPETQLSQVNWDEFSRRLRAAFALLEKAVNDQHIHVYGTATWNGYRGGSGSSGSMSLVDTLRIAEEVGGPHHHFRAIQLPFNMAMPEALTGSTQEFECKRVPALHVARAYGLMVFASASLLQGQLCHGLPDEASGWFPGLEKDAQRSIQFVRSTPGITCALVGMCSAAHVDENLETARTTPLDLASFRKIFE